MALIPVVGNQLPISVRSGKEQVPFKKFHAKRIYFSFELQTIKLSNHDEPARFSFI